MKQPLMLGLALATALSSGAAYGARERHTRLPEGTPVVVVGRISSPPRGAINEQILATAVGGGRGQGHDGALPCPRRRAPL